LETLDIILLGYGVALAYLVWENMQMQKNVEENSDLIDELISKHNLLADEFVEFLDMIEDNLKDREEKDNA
tara:strand:+ start:1042 stop:1254 length:213 start_codon:yes stop_codon:yes gene_type:complete